MLCEFAVIPAVFDRPGDSEADLHDACMAPMADLLLNDGLVRDLRAGAWSQSIRERPGQLSIAGRKLFEALQKNGRCCESVATDLEAPEDAEGWFWEALKSNKESPSDRKLRAVLAPHDLAVKQADPFMKADPFIISTRRLHEAEWWQTRSCSMRLERRTGEYLRHLGPVLRHSNSLMFIDPNLDPTKPNYAEFPKLLSYAAGVGNKPKVEVHRSRKDSSGQDTHSRFPSRNEWMGRFQPLIDSLSGQGIQIKVFVWDDFHDRHLISNLIGISVPNGFDTCMDEHRHPLRTTWTRLSRRDADDVQREFDAAMNPSRLSCEPFT